MRAGDVRCPKCGEALVDVAPDYDPFAPDQLGIVPVDSAFQAHCASGHLMIIGTGRSGVAGFSIMVYEPEAAP